MLMKVFNKGQIVIPAAVRRKLKIKIGDMLDFFIDENENCIKLKRSDEMQSTRLAGSLSKYNRRKKFPFFTSLFYSKEPGFHIFDMDFFSFILKSFIGVRRQQDKFCAAGM